MITEVVGRTHEAYDAATDTIVRISHMRRDTVAAHLVAQVDHGVVLIG